ncbi:kelch repeat-containing protein [Geothrix sp. 21YS21S-2]|uniref:Kelch repeat-containing protein n=1 Tax=Geothrix sp. 21YS21S-2 TaxID=3068893 RepID=UPI0027B95E2C|nr:kelch repeat-containing protein [Geothrix sp. 21YS21S-2]
MKSTKPAELLSGITGLLILWATGCGGRTPAPPPPIIQSFAAAKAVITAGASTTLTAQFSGGTGLVGNGIGTVQSGMEYSSGPLSSTTTFILTVTSQSGQAVSREARVEVVPAPVITTFKVSQPILSNGNAAILTYAFSGGTGSIDQGVGEVIDGGSSSISPGSDTVYTLKVTNRAGDSAILTVAVQVVAPPRITGFLATPAKVLAGGMVTLQATYEGGEGAVDKGVGPIPSGLPGLTVGPVHATTLFTLSVVNPAGDRVQATATAGVSPFVPTGAMAIDSLFGVLLPTGNVWVAGRSSTQTQTYDPATGTFRQGPDLPVPCVAATCLKDGRVLVLAESTYSTDMFHWPLSERAYLFDPATQALTRTGDLNDPRNGAPMTTLLKDGRVLITGGISSQITGYTPWTAELYDPETGTFKLSNIVYRGYRGFSATLLSDGRCLLAGGGAWDAERAYLYDPVADTLVSTGSMAVGRAYHTATLLPNGKVLFAGGAMGTIAPEDYSLFELYDPETGTFSRAGYLPDPIGAGSGANLLPEGTVLITGGLGTPNGYRYAPALSIVEALGPLNAARTYHLSILLKDGRVLLAGGSGGLLTAELFLPQM